MTIDMKFDLKGDYDAKMPSIRDRPGFSFLMFSGHKSLHIWAAIKCKRACSCMHVPPCASTCMHVHARAFTCNRVQPRAAGPDAYLHWPHDSLSSHTLHTLHILCILQICIENIKIRQFVEPCSVVDIILDYWVKGSWIESSCFQHDFITCVLGIKI